MIAGAAVGITISSVSFLAARSRSIELPGAALDKGVLQLETAQAVSPSCNGCCNNTIDCENAGPDCYQQCVSGNLLDSEGNPVCGDECQSPPGGLPCGQNAGDLCSNDSQCANLGAEGCMMGVCAFRTDEGHCRCDGVAPIDCRCTASGDPTKIGTCSFWGICLYGPDELQDATACGNPPPPNPPPPNPPPPNPPPPPPSSCGSNESWCQNSVSGGGTCCPDSDTCDPNTGACLPPDPPSSGTTSSCDCPPC